MFNEHYLDLCTYAPFPVHEALCDVDSTKINTFLDCPRQYFFEYILGWRSTTPNNHLVFGQAIHEAMEHMLLNGYDDSSVIDAFDKFLAKYRESFPESTDELFKPKTPANALRMLTEYASHYRDDFSKFRVLHTEVGGRVQINEDDSIIFRMDSILEDLETNELFSLEHKTKGNAFSRQWTDQWTHAFQVGTYSHVLHMFAVDRPVYGVRINGMALGAKKNDFLRVPCRRTAAHMTDWLYHANVYIHNMKTEIAELIECCQEVHDGDPGIVLTAFPKNPGACTKYFGCSFFDHCAAWTNPLTRCEKPPVGFEINHWEPLAEPVKTNLDYTSTSPE